MWSADLTRVWSAQIALVHGMGALHAIHAVLKVRSPQGALGWALALVGFPYVAIPLYWIFGRAKFIGYRHARAGSDTPLDQVARSAFAAFSPWRARVAAEAPLGLPRHSLAFFPATRGNSIKLLRDGAETFPALLEAIDRAESYLLVQFFIVRDDRLGREFIQRLTARARAGVRVYFLFDEVGCHKLSRAFFRELRAAGARVEPFRTTRGRGNRFQLNFRNHRKLLLADGKLALTGGLNIGVEYNGEDPRFGRWRDTHVSAKGPAVQALQMPFVEDWHWATGEILTLDWSPISTDASNMTAQVLATGPADELNACSLTFLRLINSARHRLWLASPYFVPDPAVLAALQLAALRGVDVRVMLPNRPDHWLPYLSSFSYYEALAGAGIHLYRYTAGFLHQKVALVDNDFASVGSINVDYRSFHLNFELALLVADSTFAHEVAEMLESDFKRCRRVRFEEYASRPWWFKGAVRIARLLSPVQ
ncbi:MAG: cardiolipin synthase [Verrucomicrobiales bacterium]|nr:cardiolipin synthase [Verrucomicrobiales bacterium]